VSLALKEYRPFLKARTFARSLGLRNQSQWRSYCKGELPELGTLPEDIPARPDNTYSDQGWSGIGDWLGTGNVAPSDRNYRSFSKAREFVRRLGITGQTQWAEFCKGNLSEFGKKPADIPAAPNTVYAEKGWKSWGDWVGTGTIAPTLRRFRQFEDARSFARSIKLKSGLEWAKFCKGELPEKGILPSDIPASPAHQYKEKGWRGMGDWLGTGVVANSKKQFREFKMARSFVRSLELKNESEWRAYCRGGLEHHPRRPPDIPTNPQRNYSESGWSGFRDWLGVEKND
jgi:hypothetical protein